MLATYSGEPFEGYGEILTVEAKIFGCWKDLFEKLINPLTVVSNVPNSEPICAENRLITKEVYETISGVNEIQAETLMAIDIDERS